MKLKIITCLITFICLSSYAKNIKLEIGDYQSDRCNIVISVLDKDPLEYKVTFNKTSLHGKVYLSDSSIVFSGLVDNLYEDTENEKKSYNAYGEIISKNKFIIQNYGNSMNPFVIFPFCDEKYLEYSKRKNISVYINKKAFLYTDLCTKTPMYLIKGDQVTILNEKIDKNDQKWYFINYKGKKDINMWIKAEDVDIE